MDGHTPVSRRQPRTWRITAGVCLLGIATLGVLLALANGSRLLVGSAAVLALVAGWVALRLAWASVVRARLEHAVERSALATTYRTLFEERAGQHQEFVARMSARLHRRARTINELEGSLDAEHERADRAEAGVEQLRGRIDEAEQQIDGMSELLTRSLAHQEALRQAAAADASPERDDLGADPVAALVAWEEHANELSLDERRAEPA